MFIIKTMECYNPESDLSNIFSDNIFMNRFHECRNTPAAITLAPTSPIDQGFHQFGGVHNSVNVRHKNPPILNRQQIVVSGIQENFFHSGHGKPQIVGYSGAKFFK